MQYRYLLITGLIEAALAVIAWRAAKIAWYFKDVSSNKYVLSGIAVASVLFVVVYAAKKRYQNIFLKIIFWLLATVFICAAAFAVLVALVSNLFPLGDGSREDQQPIAVFYSSVAAMILCPLITIYIDHKLNEEKTIYLK